MRQQPSDARVRAISALARSYLSSSLPAEVRADALIAMTAALDDGSVAVRRALAEALASATDAPRHIVYALAGDRAEVACPILAHSPLLNDSLLAETVRYGGLKQQIAIARRPKLGERAIHAIAEVGERLAAIAMIENLQVTLDPRSLGRLYERFPIDGELREALLARGGLPPALRVDLATASATALADFGVSRAWLEAGRADRLTREAREQAIVTIVRECDPEDLPQLADHLHAKGVLNVALLMRALLSGNVSLFETALVAMSGAPARRVGGFINDWRGRGFAAIYTKAGLPQAFLPAFRAALGALQSGLPFSGDGVSQALALRAIEVCEGLGDPELEPVLSLMWRLAGEGVREATQDFEQDFEIVSAPAVLEAMTYDAVPRIAAPVVSVEGPVTIEATSAITAVHEIPSLPPEPELPEASLLSLRQSIDFNPIPAMAFELELALEEIRINEALNQASRLDFVVGDLPEGAYEAPMLPAPLEFEGANENAAPPIEIEASRCDEIAVAA